MAIRKNYFAKLMNYMKNVYNIDRFFNRLEDDRINPKFKTGQALIPLLLGLLLRIKSMNELKCMLKKNEFAKAFPRGTRLAQVDTIRDALKAISIEGLKLILHNVVNTAVKNKTFTNGTIDGYTVAAIDGTKFFGSNKKSCPECLTSKEHHYHSGVVMSTIGDKPRLVSGFEMMRPDQDSTNKDEGEMTAAKRLITDISSSYPKFIDVVVYDALACNSKWINHCLKSKMDFIVRAKKNNNNSIKTIKKIVNKMKPVVVWGRDKEFESIRVSESTFMMDNVDRSLRFVKFAIKRLNGRYNQILIENLGTRYNIREIVLDRWGAVQMVQNLEGLGFTVVPFGQGFKDMSPPTKELMKLTLEGKIAHGGHPVLRWMMDNIFVRTDPAGNIKIDKEKSTERIDGAEATIMALDRAIRNGGNTGGSVYEDRGLIF